MIAYLKGHEVKGNCIDLAKFIDWWCHEMVFQLDYVRCEQDYLASGNSHAHVALRQSWRRSL